MASDLLRWNPSVRITKGNYIKAATLAKKIKTAQRDIENALGPSVKIAHETHKMIKKAMDNQLNQYKEVETQLKGQFAVFHQKNPGLKIDSIAFVDTLEPVIVDESKIPDKYKILVPDIVKIKEEVSANGRLFKCPGIEIRTRTQVRMYADKD